MGTRAQPAARARHRSCCPCRCPELCGELSKPCSAWSPPGTALLLGVSPALSPSKQTLWGLPAQPRQLLLPGRWNFSPAGAEIAAVWVWWKSCPCWHSPALAFQSVCRDGFVAALHLFPIFIRSPLLREKKFQKKTQREGVLMLLLNFHASVGFCAG